MELKYKSDTKHRKDYFTGISFSHPAKMLLPLQIYLIENYTKPGETILDPMAGSGTVVVACSLGRNVIALELEGKFVKMIEGNWQKIQQRGPQMGYSMGNATILQGDARNLPEVLADVVLTSPPYANQVTGERNGIDWSKMDGGKRDMTKENAHPTRLASLSEYSSDPGNIGNLKYGDINAIISSPPYEATQDLARKQEGAAVTSKNNKSYKKMPAYYTDCILTSPPYENQVHKNSDAGKEKELMAIDPKHWYPNSQPVAAASYLPSQANIGNLKGDNYLEAMLLVYQGCYRVLKPGGIMCLVVKNFIRARKIVRLDLDTIKLCEKSGFVFQERLERKILQQSFWRTLYKKRYPEAASIDVEDVLIFRKPLR